jgi:hypothetical protein
MVRDEDLAADESELELNIPVNVIVAGDRPDMADWAEAIAGKVVSVLATDWKLTRFFVASQAWAFTGTEVQQSADGKSFEKKMILSTPHHYSRGAALW